MDTHHTNHKHHYKSDAPQEDTEHIEHAKDNTPELSEHEKHSVVHVGVSRTQIPETPKELRELVEKNIKWSQVIYNQNKKIQHRLTWMAVGSYIRLLLILIPLIFALIYLPPFLKEAWKQYGDILPNFDFSSQNMNSLIGSLQQGKTDRPLNSTQP